VFSRVEPICSAIEVVEDLQHDRVDLGADGRLPLQGNHPVEHQMVALGERGPPARLDHRGAGRLDDDRRAVDPVARHQVAALIDRRVMPGPRCVHAYAFTRFEGCRAGRVVDHRVRDRIGLAHHFDRDGLDDVGLVRHDEAVALVVRRLETGDHSLQVAMLHDHGGIRAVVAQVHLLQHPHPLRGDVLFGHLGRSLGDQRGEARLQGVQKGVIQLGFDRLFAQGAQVGQAHAVGREHAGEGVQEDLGHAQGVGDVAGMLAAGATEAAQRVLGHVVAPLGGDLGDGVGHVLHRDLAEAVGHLFGRPVVAGGIPDLPGQGGEALAHHLAVQGLVAAGPEDPGKEVRLDPAQHDVGVGDRQGPATAIAGRARVGPGGVRPDPVAGAVEVQDRAAAGRHGVDLHHGRAHAHPGHLGLEGPLVLAVVVGRPPGSRRPARTRRRSGRRRSRCRPCRR
jgi:hypothetical protein